MERIFLYNGTSKGKAANIHIAEAGSVCKFYAIMT